MLAGREASLAEKVALGPDVSHYTPRGILAVLWPYYLQNLTASQAPLTQVLGSGLRVYVSGFGVQGSGSGRQGNRLGGYPPKH